MKKLVTFLSIVLIFTGTGLANKQSQDISIIKKATNKLINSLNSDNEGVRNSALVNLAQIKALYPEYDMSKAAKKVSRVAEKDNSPIVRVNASITNSILKDELPVQKKYIEIKAPDEFFNNVYFKMATSR